LREADGVIETAGGLDRLDNRAQLRQATLFYGQADQRPLFIVAMTQRMQQRQRGFAFGEVVAEILAARRRIGPVIQHVVYQLVSRAQVFAVTGQRGLLRVIGAGEHGGDLGTGFEQSAGLAIDHFEVTLLGGLGIVRIHELQHLALGDHVGGVGHDLHDPLRAHGGHHLEGARVDEVADQDAGLVAEDIVGRGAPAALLRPVDHVVVQQRGGVYEFDEGSGFDVFVALDTAGAPGQHAEQGSQAFAAATNDVLGHLVHQRHGALEAGADHGVHGLQIRPERGADLLQRQRGSLRRAGGGTGGGQVGDLGAHLGR
jgi:hypothetical protein